MSLTSPSLAPTVVGPDGTGSIADLVGALGAAQSGGDAFVVQGKEVLVINNGDSGSHTVTIKSVADNFGNVLAGNDIVQIVAAGKTATIGPLSRSKYGDANGLAQITYSAVTDVTVAILTFSTTA